MDENAMEFMNEHGISTPSRLRIPVRDQNETDFGIKYRMDGDVMRTRYFDDSDTRESFVARLRSGSRCQFFEYLEDEAESNNELEGR